MVRSTGCIILTFYLCITCMGDGEFWNFTCEDGKTMTAKPVFLDAESGKITLEQENGKQSVVLSSSFIERDQKHLEAWIRELRQAFADPANYSITVEKVTQKNSPHSRTYNEVRYRIKIINKSGVDFGSIRAACCYFITLKGYGSKKDVLYCETNSVRSGPLHLADKVEFETDSIRVHHRVVQYYENIDTPKTDAQTAEEVAGLIVRIYRNGDDDVFLEFSEPTAFASGYQWNEFPAREGLTKQADGDRAPIITPLQDTPDS